jgi:hypothetical protein
MKVNRSISACLALVAVIGIGYVLIGTAQQAKQRDGANPTQPDSEKPLPKVQSRVQGVTLENLRLSRDGRAVEFDIANETAKPILSVTIRSGNSFQTYNPDGDETFIAPGERSNEGRYYLHSIRTKVLVLSAVEFTDGEIVGTDFDKKQFLEMRQRRAMGLGLKKAAKTTRAIVTPLKGNQ